MDLQLKGKRALVAGSSLGLGYAIAWGLASEGCRVAINGRNPQRIKDASIRLQTETSSEVLPVVGDVGQPDFPATLGTQTVKAFGGLDLLVTNAGGPPSGKFEGFDDSVWVYAIELSLLSHVRLIKAALPYLRQSDCASVVTMTSYSVKQPIPFACKQYPSGRCRIDQESFPGAWIGWDPLQLHSAWLDDDRKSH